MLTLTSPQRRASSASEPGLSARVARTFHNIPPTLPEWVLQGLVGSLSPVQQRRPGTRRPQNEPKPVPVVQPGGRLTSCLG